MQTVNQILDVFEGFRMAPKPNDQYESVGKEKLANKLTTFVDTGKPIDFVMLGFPFKSTNTRDKVLGALPDKAEEVTLKNFTAFDNAIKTIYPAGVRLHMATDGFVFNELLGVPESTVMQYKEICADLGKYSPVVWYDLNDFYSGSSISDKLGRLTNQFGITAVKLQEEIMTNPDVNYLYRGMFRFMMEELAPRGYATKNQLEKAAKALTREMMLRNEAYSNLVRKEFSQMVRLSMHPSVNNGYKYSFQLIPSPKAHHSAWHCALAINDAGEIETIHRIDAETRGYELVNVNGQPYYYHSNQ